MKIVSTIFKIIAFSKLLLVGSFAFADGAPAGARLQHLTAKTSSNELSVLWWNTGCGGGSQPGESEIFDQSLRDLSKAENLVDLVVFGEDCPGQMDSEALESLKEKYPHHLWVPYNKETNHKIGFGVYSRHQFSFGQPEKLDWLPLGERPEKIEAAKSFWPTVVEGVMTRVYVPIEVNKNGKLFHVVPVHTVHPWNWFIRVLYPNEPLKAKAAVATELVWGEQNPLIWQLRNLLTKVQRDYVSVQDQKLMLIGDFNFPLHVGMITKGYKMIRELGFSDGMRVYESTQRGVNLKIDHAFVTPSVQTKNSAVLPMRGSDHFPIFLRIQ